MGPGRVLVVDDDGQLRQALTALYGRAGWDVLHAADGLEALQALYTRRPDVVVLDLLMAGLDGWETLSRIRDLTDVPVLMLSGRAGELEKVRALRAGADDFVAKPFSGAELVARTEALVRRAGPSRDRDGRFQPYRDAPLEVDFKARTVTVEGHEVALTPLEFKLLHAFVRHPDQALSADQLLHLAWAGGVGSRDQVKIYVSYLRRKLGPVGDRIQTVRGFGYRYRSAGRRS